MGYLVTFSHIGGSIKEILSFWGGDDINIKKSMKIGELGNIFFKKVLFLGGSWSFWFESS